MPLLWIQVVPSVSRIAISSATSPAIDATACEAAALCHFSPTTGTTKASTKASAYVIATSTSHTSAITSTEQGICI